MKQTKILFETIASTTTSSSFFIETIEVLCDDLAMILSKNLNEQSSNITNDTQIDDNFADRDLQLGDPLGNATDVNPKAAYISGNKSTKNASDDPLRMADNVTRNTARHVMKHDDDKNNRKTQNSQTISAICSTLQQMESSIQQHIDNDEEWNHDMNSGFSESLSKCICSLLACTSLTNGGRKEKKSMNDTNQTLSSPPNHSDRPPCAMIDSLIKKNLSTILSTNSILLNIPELHRGVESAEALSNLVIPIEFMFENNLNDIKASRLKRLYYHQELIINERIQRACENVWKSLYHLLLSKTSSDTVTLDDRPKGTSTWIEVFFEYIFDREQVQPKVWNRNENKEVIIATSLLTKAIRSHFFGTDITESKEDKLTKTNEHPKEYIHLGHIVRSPIGQRNRNSDVIIEKLYEKNPLRFHATLMFLSCLQPSCIQKLSSTQIIHMFNDLLPISYELLASSDDATIGIGASCLYHLLRSCFGHNLEILAECVNVQQQKHKYDDVAQLPFDTGMNVIHILYDVIKTCRIGLTLASLGHTQQYVFHILLQQDKDKRNRHWAKNNAVIIEETKQKRRIATQQWLLILDQNRQSTDQSLLFGLLIGGIIPLLYQHGMDPSSPRDALELGRPGLSALLPLIRRFEGSFEYVNTSSSTSQDNTRMSADCIQLATITALSNLMIAAYPIMTRHAGKILCELLAMRLSLEQSFTTSSMHHKHNIARSQWQHNLIVTTEQVASLAIAVCGISATSVLDTIRKGEYDDEIVRLIDKLQQQSHKFGN